MTQTLRWPSVTAHRTLAKQLFGPRGEVLLKAWLDEQERYIDDRAFAERFVEWIGAGEFETSAYNHRWVRYRGQALLGGIRFYGGDRKKPFVEVLAHEFENWRELAAGVADAWSAFTPSHLRLLLPAEPALANGATIDQAIFAARYDRMAPPDEHVALRPFTTAEDAIKIVRSRFDALRATEPALAQRITAATPQELRSWHAKGTLKAICVRENGIQKTVGLMAIAPATIAWLEGDVIHEEVVLSAFNGHGFAASAQRAWAAALAADRTRLLMGTIDDGNPASQRTALAAGRKAIMYYVFVPLAKSG